MALVFMQSKECKSNEGREKMGRGVLREVSKAAGATEVANI